MTDYDISISVFPHRETANIPLIALGLKETKEVDFSTLFKVQKQQLQVHHPRIVTTYTEEMTLRNAGFLS